MTKTHEAFSPQHSLWDKPKLTKFNDHIFRAVASVDICHKATESHISSYVRGHVDYSIVNALHGFVVPCPCDVSDRYSSTDVTRPVAETLQCDNGIDSRFAGACNHRNQKGVWKWDEKGSSPINKKEAEEGKEEEEILQSAF